MNTNQDAVWREIQTIAKRQGIPEATVMQQRPELYQRYKDAGKPPTNAVARDAAADKAISAEAQKLAAAKGISEADALVEMFSRTAEGRDRYARLRAPKAHGAADTGPKPLTPAEMVELSSLARRLDYDLPISQIAGLGAGFARDLWSNLQSEFDDMSSHTEGDDDTIQFAEFGPEISFSNLDWRAT